MTPKPTPQEKADALAASFNRILRGTHDAPMVVEKVAMLHIAKRLLAQLETLADKGVVLERLDAVKRDIGGIEDACRIGGLYEAFANLPRAERRRINKQIEAGQ